jgi:hypothetical protein
MTEKHAYGVAGIRPGKPDWTGRIFTVEVLGYQTRARAFGLARHYADLWNSTVELNRVHFVNTSSAGWTDKDDVQFICRVMPSKAAARV